MKKIRRIAALCLSLILLMNTANVAMATEETVTMPDPGIAGAASYTPVATEEVTEPTVEETTPIPAETTVEETEGQKVNREQNTGVTLKDVDILAMIRRYVDRRELNGGGTTVAPTTQSTTEETTETTETKETETTPEPTTEAVTEPTTQETTEAQTQASVPSPYANIAVTQITIVDSFVNIRTKPSTVDGEVVGKIYNHCAATILDTVEGEGGLWYYVTSGSCTGYMKADYFVTGDEAEALAVEIGKIFAHVDVGGLRLREEPTTYGDNVITNLWEGEIYAVSRVVQDDDRFVKITLGRDDDGNEVSGYVAREYVTVYVEFDTAISLEEEAEAWRKAEEERLAAERAAEEARLAAERAAAAAAAAAAAKEEEERRAAAAAAQAAAYEKASADRWALVSYAKQFQGVAYVWGGESLTYGVDCSGFTMLVYAAFGYNLPHYSVYQAGYGTQVSLSNIRPGDLIFYARGGVIYHVAIYCGDGQIIHAANEALGVCVSSLNYADIYCVVSIMP